MGPFHLRTGDRDLFLNSRRKFECRRAFLKSSMSSFLQSTGEVFQLYNQTAFLELAFQEWQTDQQWLNWSLAIVGLFEPGLWGPQSPYLKDVLLCLPQSCPCVATNKIIYNFLSVS